MLLYHAQPGTCRFCRCHGDHCRLPDGDRCVWLDAHRDVCNAPPCVRELSAQQKGTSADLAERKRLRITAEIEQRKGVRSAKAGSGKKRLA